MLAFYKNRISASLLLLGYITLLIFARALICDVFADVEGYQCRGSSAVLYIINALLLLICSAFISVSDNRVSSGILWVVFFFHIIPVTLFIYSAIDVDFLEALYFNTVVICMYSLVSVLSKVNFKSLPSIKGSVGVGSICLASLCVVFAVTLIAEFGVIFDPPSIFDVYSVRAAYIDRASTWGGYVSILSGYFLAPFLAVIGVLLISKQHKIAVGCMLLAAACAFSYLVFSSSGFKSVAFMCVGVVGILFSFVLMRKHGVGLCLVIILFFIICLAWGCYVLGFEDPLIHWVRRALITPGLNVAYFYDFARMDGFNGTINAPNAISNYYYGTDGSANAGFVGDSIYRFGLTYFALGFFVVLAFIKAADFFSGNNARNVLPLFLPAAYALANSSLTTVLITYGFVPMVLMVYLNRRFLSNA